MLLSQSIASIPAIMGPLNKPWSAWGKRLTAVQRLSLCPPDEHSFPCFILGHCSYLAFGC